MFLSFQCKPICNFSMSHLVSALFTYCIATHSFPINAFIFPSPPGSTDYIFRHNLDLNQGISRVIIATADLPYCTLARCPLHLPGLWHELQKCCTAFQKGMPPFRGTHICYSRASGQISQYLWSSSPEQWIEGLTLEFVKLTLAVLLR